MYPFRAGMGSVTCFRFGNLHSTDGSQHFVRRWLNSCDGMTLSRTGLFGANEPYHLIAFKEDSESRQIYPEAPDDSVPASLLMSRYDEDSRQNEESHQDTRSMISGTTHSFSHLSALQEMTLLVDVNTELHDLPQAHLNFQREKQGDLRAALHSKMPSLRKLVKPTDWEKVRSHVVSFCERSLEDPRLSPEEIRMTVKLPGEHAWLKVEEATLHPIRGAQKVWLLRGFRPEKIRHCPFLDRRTPANIHDGSRLLGYAVAFHRVLLGQKRHDRRVGILWNPESWCEDMGNDTYIYIDNYCCIIHIHIYIYNDFNCILKITIMIMFMLSMYSWAWVMSPVKSFLTQSLPRARSGRCDEIRSTCLDRMRTATYTTTFRTSSIKTLRTRQDRFTYV